MVFGFAAGIAMWKRTPVATPPPGASIRDGPISVQTSTCAAGTLTGCAPAGHRARLSTARNHGSLGKFSRFAPRLPTSRPPASNQTLTGRLAAGQEHRNEDG